MGKNTADTSLSRLKKQFKYRKPICPFICSTFQDFQEERDMLVKKVFPAIDALCRERGTYCAPVDLRWGINDHQTSSGHIINLCLDYVTKCAPFFICILGERYGSFRPEDSPPLPKSYKDLPPDAHWMDKNLVISAASGYDWVMTDEYSGSSVTALEIAQRNFLSAEFGDQFSSYYIRQQEHLDHLFTDLPEKERQEKLKAFQPESEYCNTQVLDLKAQIAKRGLTLKYFKTPEELSLLVLEDWKAVVDCLYPPFYDEIPNIHQESVTEWIAHEAFAETRRRVYVSTPELDQLIENLTQFAVSSLDEPPPIEEKKLVRSTSYGSFLRKKQPSEKSSILSTLLLVGERGCGKSSVIANWYEGFRREHPGVTVITHFVGSSAHSTDLHALMRRFTHEIRHEYPQFIESSNDIGTESAEISDFLAVREAFHAALSLGPCVLVLDGVDELGESHGCSYQQVKEMGWLPSPLPPQCKVIITSARSDTAHKALSQRNDINIHDIPLLKGTTSKSRVVKEYLAIHCKCLNDAQLDRIVSSKLSDRPIFLTVLANELRVFGVYSRLDYHLDSYLDARSIRDLWSKIILRWVKDYSWNSNEHHKSDNNDQESTAITGWVADALRLLACSRNGLSRDEILNMLDQLGYHGNTKVTTLDWALFRSAVLDSLLERPGGLLNFFHQHFKEAVEHTLLGSSTPNQLQKKPAIAPSSTQDVDFLLDMGPKKHPERALYHRHIADYFMEFEHSCRRSEELPWQLERANEYEVLTQVLSEPRLFIEMAGERMMHHRRLELVGYWKNLKQAGHDISETYWNMLRRALGRDVRGSTDSLPQSTVSSQMDTTRPSLTTTLNTLTTRAANSALTERSIPCIMRTSPSVSSVDISASTPELYDQEPDEVISEDNQSVTELTRSASQSSIVSNQSDGSVTSYASSTVDACDAFEGGLARGPREMARLAMITGQFLSVMSCFSDAERMLLTAHDKLGNICLSGESQRLLCALEESIGNMYLFQLRKEKAAHWFTRALKTVEDLIAILSNSDDEKNLLEMKGRLLDQLGNMSTYTRDFDRAETLLSRAKFCFEQAKSRIGKATVQYHIGFLRMQQGDFETAENLFTTGLVSLEQWFGKKHPRIADVLNDLAGLLSHPDNKTSTDVEQAEQLYRRALHIRETCYGPDHLMVATSLFHLGLLLKRQTDRLAHQEALTLLRRALDVRTARLGPRHCLTNAVRRALSHLEITLQNHHKVANDARTVDLPYSNLTWHDDQLRMFEKRAMRRAEEVNAEKRVEKARAESRLTATESQVYDGYNGVESEIERSSAMSSCTDDNRSEQMGSIALDVEKSVIPLHLDGHSVDEGNEEEEEKELLEGGEQATVAGNLPSHTGDDDQMTSAREPKQVQYLDSFVFKIPKMRTSRPIASKERKRSEPLRPVSAPQMNTAMSGRTTPSVAMHRYATMAGASRRIQSAPTRSRTPRSTTSLSTPGHRRCPPPGPHSIDITNAYSVVYGHNSSIKSLLDTRAVPCYNVKPPGIQHTSAWYHIPGRYQTTNSQYPRKRLQKRVNQNRHGVTEYRTASQSWSPTRYTEYSDSPSPFRPNTRGVHFGDHNVVTVQGSSLFAL